MSSITVVLVRAQRQLSGASSQALGVFRCQWRQMPAGVTIHVREMEVVASSMRQKKMMSCSVCNLFPDGGTMRAPRYTDLVSKNQPRPTAYSYYCADCFRRSRPGDAQCHCPDAVEWQSKHILQRNRQAGPPGPPGTSTPQHQPPGPPFGVVSAVLPPPPPGRNLQNGPPGPPLEPYPATPQPQPPGPPVGRFPAVPVPQPPGLPPVTTLATSSRNSSPHQYQYQGAPSAASGSSMVDGDSDNLAANLEQMVQRLQWEMAELRGQILRLEYAVHALQIQNAV